LKKIKHIFVIILLLLAGRVSFAQQYYYNTLYLFNHYSINPAAAGCNNVVNINAQIREQWNAPNAKGYSSNYLTASLPLKRINGAIGAKFSNYTTRFEKTSNFLFTYAHALQFRNGTLRFGLDFGSTSTSIFSSEFIVKQANDPLLIRNDLTVNGLNANFGMYYQTNKLFAGFSLHNLINKKITVNGNSFYKNTLPAFAMAGYSISLSSNWDLVPSVMLRYVPNLPLSVDVNASFGYHNTLWLGTTIKSSKGLGVFFLLPLGEKWRIGYTLEQITPARGIRKLFSQELNINFLFTGKTKKPSSFRYFN